MRRLAVVGALGCTAAACSSPAPSTGPSPHGRYIGLGTYSAGALWSKMALTGQAKSVTAATPADDEHVIVVVDSQTGEVRECGDYSGVCVGLNPWTKAVATPQIAPVTLTKHLGEVGAERGVETGVR